MESNPSQSTDQYPMTGAMPSAWQPLAVHQWAIASLMPFPGMIQEAIIGSMLATAPRRATDIWYEDKAAAANVHVMRSGIQWHFNEAASTIWQLLDGERTVEVIIRELQKKYPTQEMDELTRTTVEFLLHGHSTGVVELCPDSASK